MRSSSARDGLRGVVAAVVVVLSLLVGMPSIRAQPTAEQPVDFRAPQTQIVDGLDLEFACRILAASESVTVLDAAKASSWISVAPGRCTLTVYILGVPVPVPILNLTPLGRLSISIPGVAGITLGLADVSIDLVAGLAANYTGTSMEITPNPKKMAWSHWGAKSVNISADAGGEGNSLIVALPYTFWMNLAIGVSVTALGVPVPPFPVNLADIGTFEGTPSVAVPVTVDLRPSRVATVDGWAPSPEAVQVNWTPIEDADFAFYRVRLDGGGSRYVYVVDTKRDSTLTMPAVKGTDYTVSITVVDRAGQTSATRSVEIRTPGTSAASPPVAGPNPLLLILAVLAAFAVGFGTAWSLRGRRAK